MTVKTGADAAETLAYHTDALGSVVAITGEDGAVVARYAYSPYGACTVLTSAGPIAASDPSGAVTDIEEEAWSYYYNKYEGWSSPEARAAVEAANRS
ncbi:MAG: hypothetical protein LLG08_03435, partial [Actinomycetia bacterium]|nr:hypothetical protein [Actinomycetes bacterium]